MTSFLRCLVVLLCLLPAVPAAAGNTPAVQLDPDGNALLQQDWPNPCLDGETVNDPFCDDDNGTEGGGGGANCSTCQYCGMERDGLRLIPTCKQTGLGDPGNPCCDDSSGTSCIVSGSMCWRV